MDVDVDQAGSDGEAGGIENFRSRVLDGRLQLTGRGNLGHAAVFEQYVFESVDAGCRIDQVPAANE
jgi:hypothetical protein